MTEQAGLVVFPPISSYFRENCARQIAILNNLLNSVLRYTDAQLSTDDNAIESATGIESDAQLLKVFGQIADETAKVIESFQ